jgi:hypothetical protein
MSSDDEEGVDVDVTAVATTTTTRKRKRVPSDGVRDVTSKDVSREKRAAAVHHLVYELNALDPYLRAFLKLYYVENADPVSVRQRLEAAMKRSGHLYVMNAQSLLASSDQALATPWTANRAQFNPSLFSRPHKAWGNPLWFPIKGVRTAAQATNRALWDLIHVVQLPTGHYLHAYRSSEGADGGASTLDDIACYRVVPMSALTYFNGSLSGSSRVEWADMGRDACATNMISVTTPQGKTVGYHRDIRWVVENLIAATMKKLPDQPPPAPIVVVATPAPAPVPTPVPAPVSVPAVATPVEAAVVPAERPKKRRRRTPAAVVPPAAAVLPVVVAESRLAQGLYRNCLRRLVAAVSLGARDGRAVGRSLRDAVVVDDEGAVRVLAMSLSAPSDTVVTESVRVVPLCPFSRRTTGHASVAPLVRPIAAPLAVDAAVDGPAALTDRYGPMPIWPEDTETTAEGDVPRPVLLRSPGLVSLVRGALAYFQTGFMPYMIQHHMSDVSPQMRTGTLYRAMREVARKAPAGATVISDEAIVGIIPADHDRFAFIVAYYFLKLFEARRRVTLTTTSMKNVPVHAIIPLYGWRDARARAIALARFDHNDAPSPDRMLALNLLGIRNDGFRPDPSVGEPLALERNRVPLTTVYRLLVGGRPPLRYIFVRTFSEEHTRLLHSPFVSERTEATPAVMIDLARSFLHQFRNQSADSAKEHGPLARLTDNHFFFMLAHLVAACFLPDDETPGANVMPLNLVYR